MREGAAGTALPVLHVVGAAIVDGPRCLAARRSAAMPLPLKWEFPGGKVEAREDPRQALRRELREELGVEVAVGELLGRGTAEATGRLVVLDVYLATLAGGTVAPREHAEWGWFTAAELAGLDWAEADRPLLAPLAERLTPHRGGQ